MMNESNAEEMIDPRVAEREKMEIELKKINESMAKLSKQVDEIQEELDKKNKLSLPFLFTEEIWDIAKTIDIWRTPHT